jgi:3'(2'), 5'-bisphosphate nucleotidase
MPPVLLLPKLITLAEQAGEVIMSHYRTGTEVRAKADQSPVTAADEAAEAVLLAGLAELTPGIPVVAEEAVAAGHIPDIGGGRFWLVDPLDGTREFISKNGEFTVNVALIDDGRPILGIVSAPALGVMWWGTLGQGAVRREGGAAIGIQVRPRPATGAVAVASRSHRDAATDAWLRAEGITETTAAGSSLKFCLVAEGKADLYPRFGTTMEWDTAAGHAVLKAAGGEVLTTDDRPLAYGKPTFKNPSFIARGATAAH